MINSTLRSTQSLVEKKQMNQSISATAPSTTEKVTLSLKKRHQKEKRFKRVGLFAVLFGFMLVTVLITDITSKALPAFHQHWVKLDISYQSNWLNIDDSSAQTQLTKQMKTANYRKVLKNSVYKMFSTSTGKKLSRKDKRQLFKLFSTNAEFTIKNE